jgi:hypothetical protein
MMSALSRAVCIFGILLFLGNKAHSQEYWGRLTGFPGSYVHALAIDSSGRIFAGSLTGGMYRSTDDGVSWSQINSGLTYKKIHSIAINSTGIIFAGSDSGGIYRSSDGGNNWSSVGLFGKTVYSIAVKSVSEIFAGFGNPNIGGGGVYKSTNSGLSWDPVGSALINSVVNALTINRNENIFAGTNGNGVYRTTDNGINWIQLDLVGKSIVSLASKSDSMVFAGTYLEGIFISSNSGANWFSYGQSFNSCRSLALNSIGHLIAGTDREGVFRSTSDAACWSRVSLLNEYIRGIIINSGGYIFAGTDNGVYRTLKSSTPKIAIGICTLNLGTLVYPVDTILTDSFIVRNISNYPITISANILTDTSYLINPNAVSINSNDSIKLKVTFAPKTAGVHQAKVSISTDSTIFPEEVSLSANALMGTIRFSSRLIDYRSVNIGAARDTTYTFMNTGNGRLIIKDIISTNPSFIIVSRITDTLAPLAIGRDTIRFIPIIEGSVSGYIFVYSNAPTSPDTIAIKGIGTEPTSVEDESNLPTRYALAQNYPNPFNPSTHIRFRIPVNNWVSLKVFNIFGQEIATLVNQSLTAGEHSVEWEAIGFPSGIYFCRLQSGSFIGTKKITLLR